MEEESDGQWIDPEWIRKNSHRCTRENLEEDIPMNEDDDSDGSNYASAPDLVTQKDPEMRVAWLLGHCYVHHIRGAVVAGYIAIRDPEEAYTLREWMVEYIRSDNEDDVYFPIFTKESEMLEHATRFATWLAERHRHYFKDDFPNAFARFAQASLKAEAYQSGEKDDAKYEEAAIAQTVKGYLALLMAVERDWVAWLIDTCSAQHDRGSVVAICRTTAAIVLAIRSWAKRVFNCDLAVGTKHTGGKVVLRLGVDFGPWLVGKCDEHEYGNKSRFVVSWKQAEELAAAYRQKHPLVRKSTKEEKAKIKEEKEEERRKKRKQKEEERKKKRMKRRKLSFEPAVRYYAADCDAAAAKVGASSPSSSPYTCF
jgi:hypothetical protein